MNERKWLKREAPKWVEKGIVAEEQAEQLLDLYPKKKNGDLLPIFASILVGLGVLTFVASNWGEMSDTLRLLFICAALIGFYLNGYHQYEKGSEGLGLALIGIGVVTFGAGVFLTAQMFHIVSHSATTFVLWLIVALIAYLMFPNGYFYLLSLIIGTAGMIYTASSFQTFDPLFAALVVGGLGYATFRENRRSFFYLFAISYSVCGITFLVGYELSYMWMAVIYLLLYSVSLFILNSPAADIWRHMSILGALVMCFINVFMLDGIYRYDRDSLPDNIPYLISLIVLLSIGFGLKKRSGDWKGLADLVLFLPLFLIGPNGDVLYLILAFAYSLFILINGYQSEESNEVNWGTGLFLISTLVAYIQLAWDFLPKSMFFFTGGILLFLLSWYLERRRRKWLHESRGEVR